MLEALLDLDTQLFLFLNGLHQPWLDEPMYWISHKFFWIPFYGLLTYLLFRFHGLKKAGVMVLVIVGTFAITNTISTEVFKKGVKRLRPCHNTEVSADVHLVHDHCGGQYGYFSSHASNVFGLALLMGLFFKRRIKYSMPLMLFWAAVISYSRIYLGVHYPLDILSGAIFGVLTAYLIYFGVNRFYLLKEA